MPVPVRNHHTPSRPHREGVGYAVLFGLELPANTEADRDHLRARGYACSSQPIRLRGHGRGQDIDVAHFGEELHLAVAVHAAHPVLVAAANVEASLVRGKMTH